MHYDIYIYIIGNKEKVLHFCSKIFSKSLKELFTNFLVFELNFYHADQWSVYRIILKYPFPKFRLNVQYRRKEDLF